MSSIRERSKRLNQGVFITGASGSGKSRMTQRLAALWQRKILLDPMRSFDADARAETLKDAIAFLAKHWSDESFSVALSFDEDEEYRQFFGALYALMKRTRGATGNFLLVLDEVDLWSSSKDIDENLAKILRYGRHYGCSWIANCRADVHTNRDVRMNAAEILVFRQGMLSPEMAKMIGASEEERDVSFPRVARLVQHGPNEPDNAEEMRHFIAVPESFDDWLPTWEKLAE